MTGQKRKRATRVCEFCKKRKIKCDRSSPCSGCIKYGNRTCKYLDNEGTNTAEDDAPASADGEIQELKKKLKSLETVVKVSHQENGGKINSKICNNGTFHNDYLLSDSLAGRYTQVWDIRSTISKRPDPPVAPEHDTINFFEGYTSLFNREPARRRNFGPLSWFTLVRIDCGCNALWHHVHTQTWGFGEKMQRLFGTSKEAPQTERDFSYRVTNEAGLDDIRPYDEAPSNCSNGIHPVTPVTKSEASPASVNGIRNDSSSNIPSLPPFMQSRNEACQLYEEIKAILPKRKVIWLLYKRYFSHFYTFCPVVDEVVLKDQLQQILGPESMVDEPVHDFKVIKKLDFAYLGTLLLMLRFAYLTLQHNITSHTTLTHTDPDIQYLLDNPIGVRIADMSQACLNQFNLMRSSNLAIMQLSLLTRFYHMYAPEDGDGADGGDAQVFNAMLIQMAYSLGLNRDPDNFADQCSDIKQNNLVRKMWYFVLLIDMNNSITVGTPVNINCSTFDTKLPYYQPGNENCTDSEIEKRTLSCFPMLNSSFERCSDILARILDVRGNTSIRSLETRLNYLEVQHNNVKNMFDNGKLVDKPANVFTLLIQMKAFYGVNVFVLTVCSHIFNYYEKRKNTDLAFHFLRKIIKISVGDLMPFYFEYYSTAPLIFENYADFVITPSFESACHKSGLLLTGVLIRVKIAILNSESKFDHLLRMDESLQYRTHFENLKRLKALLVSSIMNLQSHMSRLSKTYYYAWRVVKAEQMMMGFLKSPEFYEKYRSEPKLQVFSYSNEMLEELIGIFEESLARVAQLKKTHNIVDEIPVKSSQEPQETAHSHPSKKTSDYASAPVSNSFSYPSSSTTQDDPHSAPSIESTNSSDLDYLNLPNDQIDRLWLSMMSSRKDNNLVNPGNNYTDNANFATNPATVNWQAPINGENTTPGIININSDIATPGEIRNSDLDGAGGAELEGMFRDVGKFANFGLTPGNDPFARTSMEELFKDFN